MNLELTLDTNTELAIFIESGFCDSQLWSQILREQHTVGDDIARRDRNLCVLDTGANAHGSFMDILDLLVHCHGAAYEYLPGKTQYHGRYHGGSQALPSTGTV